MKKIMQKYLRYAPLIGALSLLLCVGYVQAQGFGNNPATLWKLVSGALQPVNSSWTIGSSGTRVSAIYATTLNATDVVIGGAVPGDLDLPANGNITTNSSNSFATLTLYGGSGAITATAPIPTSTTLISGSFPQYTYEMNATNTNCIYWGPTYIRDAWDASTMNPRLQWQSASGTGNVIWSLRAQSVTNGAYTGAPFTAAKSYATGTVGIAYMSTNNTMTTLSVGGAATGTAMKFELCREGGHAQDTSGAAAYPNSVVIEYGLGQYSD